MVRLRKAWQVSIRSSDHPPVVYYAATQGKARYQAWLSASDCWPDLRIIDVTVRRAAWADVQLPSPDDRASALTSEERHCLLHAFGANCGDPTKAGYRDYFYTRRDDPPLVALTEHGLMLPMDGDRYGENMTYFLLTAAGREVALSLTPQYAT